MVLQRDVPVTIWGWAAPGDTITVEFAGQKKTAVAANDGNWLVKLDPLPACPEPRQLVVFEADAPRVTLHDILVGEVWLASGQSNMEWPVGKSFNAAAEMAAANYPQIRLFTVPLRMLNGPQPEVDGTWQICTPHSIETFSAVAYFFGRELHRELGMSIGLINSSKGGTRIETWTSRDALLSDPLARREIERYEAGPADEEFARDPVAWERNHVMPDPGNVGFAQGWAATDFDDSRWGEMRTPSKWQDFGHKFSGVFWFRRTVCLPAAWAGRDLRLHLGACDKHDTTYFNSVPVGTTGWETCDAWCTPREYRVPGKLVRAGRNVIATRIYSYMTDGGLIGPAWRMRLVAENDSIPLTGDWRFRIEHNFGLQPMPQQPFGPGNPNTPHILFNNMIRPLAPYAIRGVIWYQGESNATAAQHYRTLFPLMIRDWRRAFGQGDFPLLFAQIANHGAPQQQPVESGWAGLREAQLLALGEPNTGMAVTIDIGDAKDIHPGNKQDVGKRLALVARAQVYGQPIPFSGPLYRSHTVEGGAIRLHFDHADGGLLTSDGGPLKGFAIAGVDKQFGWADAKIVGDTVVVSNAEVSEPAAVRYAWASNPIGNLANSASLPASPFRTDQWD